MQTDNARIFVETTLQIIVAADETQQANDKEQPVSMLQQAIALVGTPATVTADAGYFGDQAVQHPALKDISLFVATRRRKLSELNALITDATIDARDLVAAPAPAMRAIYAKRAKREIPDGRAIYAKRKDVLEPVLGWIKSEVGSRCFSFGGHGAVIAEWLFDCIAQNRRKLSGRTATHVVRSFAKMDAKQGSEGHFDPICVWTRQDHSDSAPSASTPLNELSRATRSTGYRRRPEFRLDYSAIRVEL